MIVLNVTYQCKPELREEFLEAIMTEGIDAASRAEAGNIKYDYYTAEFVLDTVIERFEA